jgi:hypothetical protein
VEIVGGSLLKEIVAGSLLKDIGKSSFRIDEGLDKAHKGCSCEYKEVLVIGSSHVCMMHKVLRPVGGGCNESILPEKRPSNT